MLSSKIKEINNVENTDFYIQNNSKKCCKGFLIKYMQTYLQKSTILEQFIKKTFSLKNNAYTYRLTFRPDSVTFKLPLTLKRNTPKTNPQSGNIPQKSVLNQDTRRYTTMTD